MATTITREILKGIYKKYDLDYPIYFQRAPSKDGVTEVTYPFVIYTLVSDPRDYSMKGDGTAPNKYISARIQFTVYANEDQDTIASTIVSDLEELYDECTDLDVSGYNFMRMNCLGGPIDFYDSQEKVYKYIQDYQVQVGS